MGQWILEWVVRKGPLKKHVEEAALFKIPEETDSDLFEEYAVGDEKDKGRVSEMSLKMWVRVQA